ncbi:hypothetical protein BN2127_JRS3_02469 [Bacillus safensis]|nr:hypothetical protein BN2127_JRS3_02469 [Bacillus safensis]
MNIHYFFINKGCCDGLRILNFEGNNNKGYTKNLTLKGFQI